MSFYQEDEIKNYEESTDYITNLIANSKIKPIEISDLQVNDTVYINFYPNSQKYIYSLYPKYGKVLSIKLDKHFDNLEKKYYQNYIIKIQNHNGLIENLLHDGVSYYGTSLGYDYSLYLVQ